MILLPAVLAGIVVALIRGGKLSNLATLAFRLGWLALLCLLAQLYVIYAPADRLEAERSLHAALLVGSSAMLLLVVWVNRHLTAMSIIGLGLLLNLSVILANEGFMPVSRDATLNAGTRSSEQAITEGARLPRSKDVLLSSQNTRLWFLSDTIVAPAPISRVYSVGDLLVGIGIFVLLQASMVPGGRRRIEERSTAAPA